jgi:hypothetical protein
MGIVEDLLATAGDPLKSAVWAKGRVIPNFDPNVWRWDIFGSVMRYSDYGQTTDYGWEKDHIDPNGPDELSNLQPLHWLNNRRKSDKTPLQSAVDLLLGGTKR